MKLKEKIKTYNFWVSVSSAIFLIVSLIGKKYNFVVDEAWYHNLITSICSILVLLGIIAPPINLTGRNQNNILSEDKVEDNCEDMLEDAIDETIIDIEIETEINNCKINNENNSSKCLNCENNETFCEDEKEFQNHK